jgi:hypothetical protein
MTATKRDFQKHSEMTIRMSQRKLAAVAETRQNHFLAVRWVAQMQNWRHLKAHLNKSPAMGILGMNPAYLHQKSLSLERTVLKLRQMCPVWST